MKSAELLTPIVLERTMELTKQVEQKAWMTAENQVT